MAHEDVVKLAIDTYRGSLGNYSKQDADDVLRQSLFEVAGTDKIDYKTMRRFKPELFEILEEAIDVLVNQGIEDKFSEFVETRNLGWGDQNVFRVPDNGLFKVSVVSNGNGDVRRQRLDSKELTVTPKMRGIGIYEELYRFLAGRIDWVQMVNRVAQSYNAEVGQDIYNAIYNSYNDLTAPYQVNSTGFQEDALLDLVSHVEAANQLPASVWGTKSALSKVTTAEVSESMKDAKNQQGFYGIFQGTNMNMVMQAHTPGTNSFAIDNNFLIVAPQTPDKFVKLVTEGDSIIREDDGTQRNDMQLGHKFFKSFGVGVLASREYGIYRIN